MVNERAASILTTLVREYIATAVPVASESVARKSPVKVSPATVRNMMASLEDAGYILRPHISSGGVPSNKGYRFYVESIDMNMEPSPTIRDQVWYGIHDHQRDLEGWVRLAATVLSALSENMAVVTYPRASLPTVKHVQIVKIQESTALLIVVLDQARLRKQIVWLDEQFSQDYLSRVANKLNGVYKRLTYKEMEGKTVEFTAFENKVRQNIINLLKEEHLSFGEDHSIEGIRRLLSQPEFINRGKVEEVLAMLDEKMLIRSILLEASEEDIVAVHIGEENSEENLKPFSVVLCNYGIPDEASGVIGVIGPPRMNYFNVIGGVRLLSNMMSELVVSLQNGEPK
jgi:heat-inducible transcriptional repressor